MTNTMILGVVKIKNKGIRYRVNNQFMNFNDTNTYGQEWTIQDADTTNYNGTDDYSGYHIQDEDPDTGYYSV